MRRGFQNSPGNAPPISRAACGERPEPRHAAVASRPLRNRRTPHRAECTIEVILRRFEESTAMSRAAVLHSTTPQSRQDSLPQRNALAAFGSSTSTPATPNRGHLPNDARTGASSKLFVIEAAECRRQATKCPDERELRRDVIDDETEPDLRRELETRSASRCASAKRISRREKICDQDVATLYAAHVRSPILFAASKPRRWINSRGHVTVFRPWT